MYNTHIVRGCRRSLGDNNFVTEYEFFEGRDHTRHKTWVLLSKGIHLNSGFLLEDVLDVEPVALAVKFLAFANVMIFKIMHPKYNVVMIMNSPPKLLRDMFVVVLISVAQFPEPSHLSLMFWRSLFCSRVIIASEKSLVKDEFFLNACNPL